MRYIPILLMFLLVPFGAQAASREEINAEVREAIRNFRKHTPAGRELANRASGMLVFPSVIKAGIGIGGEYGEGALLVKGKTVAYYNIAAASIGFQLGAQARSQIVLFMKDKVLADFRWHIRESANTIGPMPTLARPWSSNPTTPAPM